MRVWLLPLAAARATTCPSAVPTAAPTVVTTASNVSCGFDGGWCGWDAGAAVDGASAAWARASGSTTTRNTGPSGDASGAGSYAFVESSYPNHPAVVFELLSPEFAAADQLDPEGGPDRRRRRRLPGSEVSVNRQAVGNL